MPSARKTKSLEDVTFNIGGAAVRLEGIPARTYDFSVRVDESGNPIRKAKEQKLFKIYVDDHFVGHASKPYGFGRQAYQVERVEGGGRYHYGHHVVYGNTWERRDPDIFDLPVLAEQVLTLRRKVSGGISTLPTQKELAADIAERDSRKEQSDRDAADRIAREKAEAVVRQQAAERKRSEILEGLRSIQDRLLSQLANFEQNALQAAIESYTKASNE